MKTHLLIESVLIGMLGVHGWMLLDRMPPSLEALERGAAEANQRLRFVHGRGVGVQGQRIDLGLHSDNEKVVAFLLRSATLRDDLAFWEAVARHVPPTSGVMLLAYCDGPACVQGLASRQVQSTFPVIAYGEVVASQVVYNADLKGQFVTSGEDVDLTWRQPNAQPADIAGGLVR